MNKIIYVAILGAGVYAAKKYLQSYANRQRFFDILDDSVSFIKKSINRGFDKDTSGNFSAEITEIFYVFEAAKRKSFETFFELQKALAEIGNIKPNISLLRMMPIRMIIQILVQPMKICSFWGSLLVFYRKQTSLLILRLLTR